MLNQKQIYALHEKKQTVKDVFAEHNNLKVMKEQEHILHKRERKVQNSQLEKNYKYNQNTSQKSYRRNYKKPQIANGDKVTSNINDKYIVRKKYAKKTIQRHDSGIKNYGEYLKSSNSHGVVTRDLQKKVRENIRGVRPDKDRTLRISKSIRIVNRTIEHSRADEAKPCDLLRAYMEQRDQWY